MVYLKTGRGTWNWDKSRSIVPLPVAGSTSHGWIPAWGSPQGSKTLASEGSDPLPKKISVLFFKNYYE